MDEIVEFALRTSNEPLAYLVLFLLIVADGLIPAVPSETTTVAFAALVRGHQPQMFPLLIAAAWLGAWLGDNLAFFVGHNRWLRESRLLKGRRISKALAWAHDKFTTRGVPIIVIARFLPIFRVAVNITAGMAGMKWSRFALISFVTAGVWCGYTVGAGWAAGHWVRDHPILSIVCAAGISTVVGLLVDKVAQAIVLRRRPGANPALVDETAD